MLSWTLRSLAVLHIISTHLGTNGRPETGVPDASASRYGSRSALAGSWSVMFLKRMLGGVPSCLSVSRRMFLASKISLSEIRRNG